MSSAPAIAGNSVEAAQGNWRVRAALAVLVISVSYNFPLAIINNHVFGVGRGTLIIVETLLMAAGLALAVSGWRPEMTRWMLMIASFLGLSLITTQFRQAFDPKSFRDMLMFAVFIMLGMTIPLRDLRRVLVGIHVVILVVMCVEISFPTEYGNFLGTKSYIMSSRGMSEEQMTLSGESELFGAVRPDDRYFLPALGWIRASSIFLEPLSMGNYASFAMLAILVFWRDWSWRMQGFMIISSLTILVGSDGRFAGVSAMLLFVLSPLLRRLPAILAIVYLPLGVALARLGSQTFHWSHLEDNFTGRMARGMKHLFKMDWYDLAGFSVPTPALADSGISYLVMSQSLLGVIMMQLFLYLHPGLQRPEQRLVVHGTALTFALAILVSISMLSIKTAGFYWVLFGAVLVWPEQQNLRRP